MTSVLNVDTIAAKNGTSPVTLTKQQAIKTWVNYDAADQATRGSFAQSSLTDVGTGIFRTTHTNNMNSAEDKCVLTNHWDTTNEGSSGASGASEWPSSCQYGSEAAATTHTTIGVAQGSTSSGNGALYDTDGNYIAVVGDLA
ncbi:MAG: hypothetical protein CBC24_08080 [Candidatus Pelagibacter sp. TMED64]|jgi:hypothetical protein|nr:MAG: hypothetical protein CBC24_08080 [Candidatus Pelagibacter sp. TMED64]|tara:strand:+ start:507 stop:932 length:426 start_codon:yes stop_codon:yes gene_type:complete